jgi:hypothetical protein
MRHRVPQRFEGVLDALPHIVRLQNIHDADLQQSSPLVGQRVLQPCGGRQL